MFLHNHPKFKDLIETIAFEQTIPLAIVEKDYWVMHALWGLSQCGFTYYFKGGTSLSKGFAVIKRFSEDLDLQIDPPKHLKVYTGKNHQKAKHRESRQVFFEWIVENISIPDLKLGSHRATESKVRNYAIELHYNSLFPRDEIIKRHVLLEIGFARVTPFETKEISSWSYDRAAQSGLEINDNRAKAVPLYLPEYTLIEKLDAINGKYQSEKAPADWV
ncbi:MAG: nucleotidyl transferase AbiEii/AbiGii toxin family protein, partial [Bdellovibrionales bacterium]|nr:nucleotidyl transferase AbiEii/AbiGii toxin family protein [Bdellovibrionales bacterium]